VTDFLIKQFCDKVLSRQHVARNSPGLNPSVMKQGENDLRFSLLHRVHGSSKLSPLQYRNEPISASGAPAYVLSPQHASYVSNMVSGGDYVRPYSDKKKRSPVVPGKPSL